MRILCLITLIAVSAHRDVLADGDVEIKRGIFPYMAFVYYSDESILDETNARFSRGAVLIKPEWLLSSSLASGDSSLAFPKKTLLARLGAVSMDSKFTFNEDEDEQEREIIQIIRPNNYTASEWWKADVSLLKTLLPFNMSASVAVAPLSSKADSPENNCFVLLFEKRFENSSEERVLTQLFVELLVPSQENCGSFFQKNTMTCGTAITDKKSNFCQGNKGSPLVCNNELTGIQSYVNDCKQPYLYQLLKAWKNFISCGVEDRCQEGQCANICFIINKDSPISEVLDMLSTYETKFMLAEILDNTAPTLSSSALTEVIIQETSEITTEKPTVVIISEEEYTQSSSELTTILSTSSQSTTTESTSDVFTNTEPTDWTNERERNSNIEAQQTRPTHKLRSAASVNTLCSFYVIFSSSLIYLTFY